jgi:hypothetical protein
VQNGFLAVDHQGVARVMPALKTHDRRRILGEQIHDLTLALVAPLRADDDYVFAHVCFLKVAQ